MRTLSLWLSLLVLAAVTLAACGGDDGKDISGDSAPEIIKQTFGPDEPVKSGVLDLTLGLDAKGLQGISGPLSVTIKGPFASNGDDLPKFDLDAALSAAGSSITAGAVSTGEKGFLSFNGQTFDLGEQSYKQLRDQYQADAKKSDSSDQPSFSSLGIDPSRWLKSPTKAGEEQVGGAATEHVKAQVDVPAMLEDVNRLLAKADQVGVGQAAGAAGQTVPKTLTDAQRQQIQQAVTATSLDVWAQKDGGALRQLKLSVGFDVPKAAQAQAGGLTSGTLTLQLGINGLNEDQSFPEPSGALPLSALTGAGATGASGSAGITTQTPAPATGATDSGAASEDPNPAYTKCLTDAGSDLTKVRACAPLVNGG